MSRLEDLISQLSLYVGRLQVEKLAIDKSSEHIQEIEEALEEVRANLEWCLAFEPELEDYGVIKPGLTDDEDD